MPTRHLPPRLVKTTVTVVSTLVALWAAGFLLFLVCVITAKPEEADRDTDVIVVLTGGTGRIEQGFQLMADGRANGLLITGVHPNVNLQQLVNNWNADAAVKEKFNSRCCTHIEHAAFSTEENATETLAWLNRNGGSKGLRVRLVTSDYHMPRARYLFRQTLPETTLLAWPVPSAPITSPAFWRNIFVEYTKMLLTWIS